MADNGWGDLERLAGDAMQSAREFTASTRGGAGSPIERRMADAFTDVSESLAAQAKALESIAKQQGDIDDRLDRITLETASVRRAAQELRETISAEAREAIADGFNEFGGTVDDLKERAGRTISALERLDGESTEEYRKAVEESVRRLKRTTAGACAVIVLVAVVAGVWALVGASWFVRMSPEIQAFATTTPALVIGIALPLAIFLAGFLVGKDR